MPTVTLNNVQVVNDSIVFNVDTDITVGSTVASYTVQITRPELNVWLQDNPGKTVDDFILQKVQEKYKLLLKMSAKAQTLVDKTISW